MSQKVCLKMFCHEMTVKNGFSFYACEIKKCLFDTRTGTQTEWCAVGGGYDIRFDELRAYGLMWAVSPDDVVLV